MIDKHIVLEKIIPDQNQIKLLYELLKYRKFIISHTINPSFKDHKIFVLNNPYRKWYLIKMKKFYLGTVYLQYDNSIGLNFSKKISLSITKSVLDLVVQNIKPLKAKPSVRFKNFYINIPFNNKILQNHLIKLGYVQTQISFIPKKWMIELLVKLN